MDDRNPYLLLGIDYGTGPDLARRSFARAARRIRRSGGGSTGIEDLNWALHEIQHRRQDPADSVTDFRVPADPAVFHPTGHGVFAPRPRPLARRTTTTESDVDSLLDGLADDVWTLFGPAVRGLAQFDFGYAPAEGDDSR